jgi:diguanylate cyclase (GGDEF)-like protein
MPAFSERSRGPHRLYDMRGMSENRRLSARSLITDLPNRRAFDEKLRELHGWWERHECDYALAIFDLDQFKAFNDAHGHAAGDAILKTISKRLTEIRRSTDFLARIGGEEFAILVPRIGLPQCEIIVDQYRKAIEATAARRRRAATSSSIARSETLSTAPPVRRISAALAAAHAGVGAPANPKAKS